MQKKNMSGKGFQEMLYSALVFAAAKGDARKVAMLLSQGGRVDTRNKDSI